MFGVAIQAADAPSAVAQIKQAEAAGIDAAWATMGGAGGVDLLPTYAAALVATDNIKLGTAIVHTWSRHVLVLAQESLALEQLAPGRFRLGIGPTSAILVNRMFGMEYRKPLTNLRENLVAIRALLHEGEADQSGEHVRVRGRLPAKSNVPVMASALRLKSFDLCGELSDGAISWMCPLGYLSGKAIDALNAGAARAGREAPPLVAHVPVAVSTDRASVREKARVQLAMYARVPNYQGMFATAGYDVSEGYSDELLNDLVVSGTEAEVAEGLGRWKEAGMGEILAHPLIEPDDREGSIDSAFAAVARASK